MLDLEDEVVLSIIRELDSMSHEEFERTMAHHGIKGQRWGIRRKEGPDGNVSSNPSVKTETPTSSGPHPGSSPHTSHLSNEELRKVVERMRLEKDLASLASENQEKADGFIKGLMKDIGKKQVRSIAGLAADVAVEQALAGIGRKSGNPHVSEVATRLGKKNRGKK